MGKRIYCGNLSFQTTQEEVRGLFAAHGEVTDVHVVMDRDTGRPRGFAFVEMASEAQAKAAITALVGQSSGGRNLKVNEAQAREDRGGGGGGGGSRGSFGGGGGGGGGGSRY
jgi:RNA recognition motif-containing protein